MKNQGEKKLTFLVQRFDKIWYSQWKCRMVQLEEQVWMFGDKNYEFIVRYIFNGETKNIFI